MNRHSWQSERIAQRGHRIERVLALEQEARNVNVSQIKLGEWTGCSARTIRRWKARQQSKVDLALRRGRPPVKASAVELQSLLDSIREHSAQCAIEVFQGLHPQLARREVESIVKRYREHVRSCSPKEQLRLQWTQPGTVWATDHSHAPTQKLAILACRDLASHQQLIWTPCRETARATVENMEECFREQGAPLVLKADGGPAFRSEEFGQLLDHYGVELLPSPYYYPQYNGSCEAANHSMKVRTERIAQQRNRCEWQPWDLELARLQANHTARPWGVLGKTPQRAWDTREEISRDQRAMFRQRCAELIDTGSPEELQNECQRRACARLAVSRALIELGLLKVRRTIIRPPIQTIRSARIS